MTDMSGTPAGPSSGPAALLSKAMAQFASLFRKELALARAETEQAAKRALAGVGLIIAGIVAALTALNVLAAALVVAISEMGLEPGWSSLLVGVGFALVAAALVAAGARAMKPSALTPDRTLQNVRKDTETLKESL